MRSAAAASSNGLRLRQPLSRMRSASSSTDIPFACPCPSAKPRNARTRTLSAARAPFAAEAKLRCVFTVPPDACDPRATSKRWPGEPNSNNARASGAPARRRDASTLRRLDVAWGATVVSVTRPPSTQTQNEWETVRGLPHEWRKRIGRGRQFKWQFTSNSRQSGPFFGNSGVRRSPKCENGGNSFPT